MDSRWLWAILLLIIIVLGGWYLLASPRATQAPATDQTATTTGEMASTTPAAAMAPAPITVTYTDQGFSPKSVTITEGQTVTWVNNASDEMWVASAPHPSHTGYDGTSRDVHCAAGYTGPLPFDECASVNAGGTYSFTFTKVGDWKYHNHGNASDFGEVIVSAPSANSGGVDVSASTSVNVL